MPLTAPRRLIVVSLSQPLVAEDWRDAIQVWDPSVEVVLRDPRDPVSCNCQGSVIAIISGDDAPPLETAGAQDILNRAGGWHIRMTNDNADSWADPGDRRISLMVPVTADMMHEALMRVGQDVRQDLTAQRENSSPASGTFSRARRLTTERPETGGPEAD